MKKIAAALTMVVTLALLTGLLLWRSSSSESGGKQKAATASEPKQRQESKSVAVDVMRQIDELAAQKNPSAREELVQMYVNWAGKPERTSARRAIVRKIVETEEPGMALQLIVTAVSRDRTPLKSDEMLSPVARDMAPIWKNTDLYSKGMDAFRLNDDVKGQALIAESLSVRLVSPPSGMENVDGQRYALVGDLTHVYREGTQDSDLKTQLLKNITDVGGSEMAELAIDALNPRAAYYRRMEAEQEQAVNHAPPPQ